ncbi:cytochrome C biogenesis protein [Natrialbaceae archaeon A-gly3]
MVLFRFAELFLIGIATPLTAACVLPLYPAFLGYLASVGERGHSVTLLGGLVVAGVLSFMALVGVVFTLVLGSSVSVAVESVSPVAFLALAAVGLVLLVDPSGFSRLPAVEPPHSKSPRLSAFGYGFFFGAIVIPCNPGLIALFFARTPVLFDSHLESMAGFLAFGLGIGAPLLAFAVLSEPFSRQVTRTLARYSDPINRGVGAVLVGVSAYYLTVVFRIVPIF